MFATVSHTAVSRPARKALPALAVLSAMLMAGCAGPRDSITVGSVPDDYRTNHPITVAEKQEVIDIPVSSGDFRMTRGQRDALDGFLYRYDRTSGAPVAILVPAGSANAAAASNVAADMSAFVRKSGISSVYVQSYPVDAPDVSAPVRVTYVAVRAQTGPCGRWPEDIANTPDNKHYANFGCSYQNNLAAQIANPNDLIGPRRPTEIDAERRAVIIGDYQQAVSDWVPETEY